MRAKRHRDTPLLYDYRQAAQELGLGDILGVYLSSAKTNSPENRDQSTRDKFESASGDARRTLPWSLSDRFREMGRGLVC